MAIGNCAGKFLSATAGVARSAGLWRTSRSTIYSLGVNEAATWKKISLAYAAAATDGCTGNLFTCEIRLSENGTKGQLPLATASQIEKELGIAMPLDQKRL